MINTMISIPVHEKTEVVIDQIINFQHFCPDCGIVLHISKSFDYNDSFHTEKEFLFILSTFKNVFVNPNHLDTAFADIVHTHVSNFKYVSKIVDFEYFALGASNELFVRVMPEIKVYDANFIEGKFEKSINWYWYNHALNDQYLKLILDHFGGTISDVRQSQIEGSFYKKDVFVEVSKIIDTIYNYEEVSKKDRIVYPREEIYYPTIAYLSNKNLKNQELNYTFVAWENPNYLPTIEEINTIANGEMQGKYSIKRVLRNFNDPVRFLVGTQIGNYRNTSLECIKIQFVKMSRKFFNLASGRRRIFVGHEDDEALVKTIFNMNEMDRYLPFNFNGNAIIVNDILFEMQKNHEALFVMITKIYPNLANILLQQGFRENIDFIDGTLLIDL